MKLRFLLGMILLLSPHTFALNSSDQSLVYEAYSLEAQGNVPKAIEKMKIVLTANPNDYLTQYRLGLLYFLDKNYKLSIEHLKKATTLDGDSIEPYLGLTKTFMATTEYKSAVGACSEVLKRDWKNLFCLQRITIAHNQLREPQKALERALEGLRIYPLDPIFLEQKVVSLYELGNFEAAKKAAESLLLVNPKSEYAKKTLLPKSH